ncbi:single-stranded DNA-binding protein [Herbiconiux sp. VKM Ac-2851]|uniref:single-stranded DNA-binding protein n=1 Tax=Herbiconiux sp. VKM Ac-2851 TaxID=2739025 RepID=UPI00156300B7|nr:single-stranded DNA-binding protein [Herbiconiux sp. VKM Ac-2851]NQX37075.1 single-stranded DNA-binding protein [Herbiconiux sp. VKM Ac-2851]
MSDIITITGTVATDPRHIVTQAGLDVSSFRLASTHRRFDATSQTWVDSDTNWFTVTGFRQLAVNATGSLRRGEHVIVTGKLRVRAWEQDGKTGTNVEIEAGAIGHDLSWGTTVHTKNPRREDATDSTDTVDTPTGQH